MNNTPAILLSTFNGERFPSALLDSLVGQLDIQPVVYWRDDGSTDSIAQIVRSYRASIDLREVLGSGRLGSSVSFLTLLRKAAPHHASFHFGDQDDIWNPGKVAHAHQVVTQIEAPTLFHCRQQLIDSSDLVLRLSRQSGHGSFSNALCENIAVGCTVALNHSAVQFVVKANEFKNGSSALWESPLIGYGFGLGRYSENSNINQIYFHNSYLQFSLKTGIMGLFVLLILFFTILWRAFRTPHLSQNISPEYSLLLRGMAYGLIGSLLATLSNPHMTTPLFVASLALLMAFTEQVKCRCALRAHSLCNYTDRN